MQPTETAYGTQTYSTTPCWNLICDEQYYYSEPMFLGKGHREIGYYSKVFNTEAEALQYITDNNLTFLDESPPYREEDGELMWFSGEVVEIGWLRTYNEIRYKCRQAHTTQSDWTPDITPALWEVVPSGKEWQAGVWYSFDCTYEGNEYKIIQPHMSQVGWEPQNVPALWQLKVVEIPGEIPLWQQPQPGVDEPFMQGAVVNHNGQTWVCDVNDNWWEPGWYGWSVVHEQGGGDNPCDTIPVWDANEGYTNMAIGDLRKVEVEGVWKVYKVINLGFVNYDPSGPNSHYGWTYQYDC